MDARAKSSGGASVDLVVASEFPATKVSRNGAAVVRVELAGGGSIAPGWYRVGGVLRGVRTHADLEAVVGAGRATLIGTLPVVVGQDSTVEIVCRVPPDTLRLQLAVDVVAAGTQPYVRLHFAPVGIGEVMRRMLSPLQRADGSREVLGGAEILTRGVRGLLRGGPVLAALAMSEAYRRRLFRLSIVFVDPSAQFVLRTSPFGRDRVTQFVALDQLSADDSRGVRCWIAAGDDPKFHVAESALPAKLPAGWYRIRALLPAIDGRVVGPCLYPDYGLGESEGAQVPLGEPDEEGRLDLLVVLRHPVRALRFDPTMRQASFRIESMRIERLGRVQAFAYMLSRLNGGPGGDAVRARGDAARRFVGDLFRQGLSGATRGLYRNYQRSTYRSGFSYESWVQAYDTFTSLDLMRLRARAAALDDGPLFSIIVPVYQTPEVWLRKCLDSVLAQIYPRWELCIADDASPPPHVRRVLAEYSARDPRIKVMHREHNGHISAASNSALGLATGRYVGLLDHDDELRPHALLEVAEALQREPSLKVIYSDEDKIDEQGRRFDPYFKPDWNPDLLRSQNYLCHFSVLDTGLVREVGGFRLGYEGSQDHDLLLRCTERAGSGGVHHIPRVLYHWRAIAGSTALARDTKDYAADAGARAVADHLVRIGADARVEQLPHGHYRVHWGLGPKPPKVTLVIPTRDRVDLLRKCVESLLAKTDYPDFEIVVVDNQSQLPETFAYFAELERGERTRVLRYDAPFNYSAINNWAVAQCDGDILGLLNNDVEVITGNWLREMASQALRPEIGAVGAMLYYPNETIQHAGVILGLGGIANHAYLGQPRGFAGHGGRAKVVQGMSAVTAACLVVRREAYNRVGGFDESLKVAFNDVDLCLRLREAGLQNLWTPFAEFYHHESASRGSEDTPEKTARFQSEVELMEKRWGELLYWDPAYNPNLTLLDASFGYGFPPRGDGAAMGRSR